MRVFSSHASQYTIGLGAGHMAYADDQEDINSFLLTGMCSLRVSCCLASFR